MVQASEEACLLPDQWGGGKTLRVGELGHLTWNDLYYIPNTTLTPDEKDRIWQRAGTRAGQLHNQDRTNPVADDAVL